MEYNSDRVNRRKTLYYRPCLRRNQTAIMKKVSSTRALLNPFIFIIGRKMRRDVLIAIYPAF